MLSVGYVTHAPHFVFSRGSDMEHWTLEYFSAGEVVAQTPSGRQLCRAPAALLIPPHTPYGESGNGGSGWTEHYIVFDPLPHWHALLRWPPGEGGLGVLNLSDSTISGEVETALQAALRAQRSARPNRRLLARNAVERALLTLDEINPARGYTQRDERIEQALEEISAHYGEALDLARLARRVYLSPSRFAHLFKAQMKQSPMQYVEQYRLERAAEKLLAGHDPVEQIARDAGFTNAFHFSTRFRRRFGQPPSRYRRNPH
jgi:AraC family transcriptional regulator of arabinose operon